MADNFNTNLTTTNGPDFASFELTGGPTGGTDIQHSAIFLLVDPDGVPFAVAPGSPFPVGLGLVSPQSTAATSAAVAAGGSVDLDSGTIASGKTGKLIACYIVASVSLKGELKTVLNAVVSSVKARTFALPATNGNFEIPDMNMYTQAHDVTAGFDGFRVTVTNLDPASAADVYAQFYYDEV